MAHADRHRQCTTGCMNETNKDALQQEEHVFKHHLTCCRNALEAVTSNTSMGDHAQLFQDLLKSREDQQRQSTNEHNRSFTAKEHVDLTISFQPSCPTAAVI